MINELKEEVQVSKKLLDTLPKNNIKNRQKYKEKLEETKNDYEKKLNEVITEIKRRQDKYSQVYEDETLHIQLNKIENIQNNLFLLNNYNTAYEKFNFDKILYELNHFYKDDLEKANHNIYECINIFKNAGIILNKNDFNYSIYAHEYMEVLLENPDNEDKIKACFEKIYWQCSDILKHIELNIKYLYYKHQNTFEKYALSLKNNFIKQYDSNILKIYKDLRINYDFNKSTSLYIGLNKFLNKELNITDYQLSKVEKYYQSFTDEYKNDIEEVNEEINKLSLSVLEYKNYLYFKYIIDEVKKVYKEKDSYKNLLKNKLKTIQKKEKTIISYNKKLKNKLSKKKIKLLTLIEELEILYKELDDAIFYDRVYKYLSDDSSIYEAMYLVCSHYSYFIKCMKNINKDGNFNLEYQKLIEFLLSPYNNILNNIAITDDKDLPLIISDRYKLSNMKITKEMLLTEESMNELISIAKKIEIYNKIVIKISYENIKFLVDIKEIL